MYCCNDTNELVLEVSTDSINWTTFDAKTNIPINIANSTSDVTTKTINISAVVGANGSGKSTLFELLYAFCFCISQFNT